MRLAVLNINQENAVKIGLDMVDIMLIDWFVSFSASGKMECRLNDNNPYFWVSYKKIIEDLPILGLAERGVGRRFAELAEKGIFSSFSVSTHKGKKVFFRLNSDKYDELYSSFGMSTEIDMQSLACQSKSTCACQSELTCSYTISKEIDISDNLLEDIVCSAVENSATESAETDEIFTTLPCKKGSRNKATEYSVKESEIKELQETYTAVDVRQQIKNMEQWLKSHPTRLKTADGIRAFITSWLAREQDRGHWRYDQQNIKTSNDNFDKVAGGEISL